MTQLPLIAPDEPADDIAAYLRGLGLPYEVRRAGVRLCRHHGLPIRARGYPCRLCVEAGRDDNGKTALLVEDENG